MDYPPRLNLALSSQMEVKGERSGCRMTHIASMRLRLPEGHSELEQNCNGSSGITCGGDEDYLGDYFGAGARTSQGLDPDLKRGYRIRG